MDRTIDPAYPSANNEVIDGLGATIHRASNRAPTPTDRNATTPAN